MNFDVAPIVLDLSARTEKEAVGMVFGLLQHHPHVIYEGLFWDAVWEREQMQTPLLGNGIALPHARTGAVSETVFAIGRCRQGVPFGPGGDLVRLIFLYGVPPEGILESLAVVAKLAKKLRDPEIRAGLLAAATVPEFRRLLA